MYTPFATTGSAAPTRFRIGARVQFIETPILAHFIPAGVTGKIVARVGYRAFEIECDGHALAVIDMPENMQKCAERVPYVPATKFISRRK